jgi:Septum formation
MSVRVLSPLALALLLAACGGNDGSATGPEAAGAEDIDVFELAVGDCVIDETQGEISETTKVPCSTPHLSEVYHLFDLPAGAFPEAEALSTAVEQGCLAAFEPYVGLDYESSEYVFSWLEPTPESWANGDREVVCMLATQDDSKITGSLRNAKR